ncbi:MAG: POTRA domain-containing protein [Spirochaetales bacterium]|nr:POTRA domain-containing protein [Spirochaetales bacterium]
MFRNRRSILLLIGVLLSLLGHTLAADQIEAITIEGLKRTKEDTLLRIINLSPGDEVTPGLSEEVEQKLRKAGIFQEDMSVTFTPGREGQILNIRVYDKWTLIGLPYFSSSDGDIKGGVFALDSNMGGKGNYFVSALMFSNEGDGLGFFFFNDPTFLDTDYKGKLVLNGGFSTQTNTSLDGDEIWEDYQTALASLGVGLGKDVNDSLNLSLLTRGTFWEDREGDIAPPEEGEAHFDLILEGRAEYDGLTVYPLFQKGMSGKMSASARWEPAEGDTSYLLYGEFSAAWAIDSLLQLTATGKSALTNDDFHYLFRLGDASGSLTLPSDKIATDRYLNGELKGEVRLVKIGEAGYLTSPLYYEAGVLRDYQEEEQTYHGMGGGIRFYLNKVALPAMGLDYRYNLTTDEGAVSFFIGMSY